VSPGVFYGKQYKYFRFCGKLIVFWYDKAKVWGFTPLMLRQYRTINGYRLCHTLSLHISRQLTQILLDRRKPACTQFIQSD
jgi:hypothetical protein